MPEDATFAEVHRLLSEGRAREAASHVQWKDGVSLAAYLERAFRAQPSNAWLIDMLCRELWRQNDRAGLEAALSLPAAGDAGVMNRAWHVLLHARDKDQDPLELSLAHLVRGGVLSADFTSFLERELAALKCLRLLDQVLEAAVAENSINMSFATLFTRRACHRKQWEVRRHFTPWIERAGARAAEPVAAFLDAIGDIREAGELVPELITAHGAWMRGQAATYGKCGYALANSGLHAETAAWLEGCETREDLLGWIAANQVIALWRLNRPAEAGQVAAEVLRRGLRDSTWDWNAAAAAFGHALSSNINEAQEALGRITGESEPHAEFSWTVELTRSVLRVLQLPQDEARRAFHEERQRLRIIHERIAAKLDHESCKSRYRLALEVMGRHGGFRVWPWHRRLREVRTASPLRGTFWVGGIALLLLAVLRGCLHLNEGPGRIENQDTAIEALDEMPGQPASAKEIDKLMTAPQARPMR